MTDRLETFIFRTNTYGPTSGRITIFCRAGTIPFRVVDQATPADTCDQAITAPNTIPDGIDPSGHDTRAS